MTTPHHDPDPGDPLAAANSSWLEDERSAVRLELGRLELHLGEVGYGPRDQEVLDKAGAVLAHGHRYAHKVSMLTGWGSNTEAARTEAGQAQQTWSDAREALRSADPGWMVGRILTETDEIRDRARNAYLERTGRSPRPRSSARTVRASREQRTAHGAPGAARQEER